ncbi:MAG: EamA family transporter [Candidatus Methylomirabilota bacterium]
MIYLLAASLIWAFSFGLIKSQLSGVPPHLVACLRLLLSAALFAPWCRPRRIPPRSLGLLALCGALQYGAMYLAYLAAFRHLRASEVALWTVFTPIYVVLIADLFARAFRGKNLLAALLSVAAAWLVMGGRAEIALTGILLVQLSNLCFAGGQVWYRRLLPPGAPTRDHEVFAALYLGGTLLAALPVVFSAGMPEALRALSAAQIWTLLYLGLIPSGLAFFLWNAGVRRSGEGTAAVLNNAKIPLAILVSWLLFEPLPTPEIFLRTAAAVALLAVAVRLADLSTDEAATG